MENLVQRPIHRLRSPISINLKGFLLNHLYFLIFLNRRLGRNQPVITVQEVVQGILLEMNLEVEVEAEVEAEAVVVVVVAAAAAALVLIAPFLMLIKKVNQAKVVES